MIRQFRQWMASLSSLALLFSGCHPTQPFYFSEDGDFSHYINVATDIEYPDVEVERFDEVDAALPPRTVDDPDYSEAWDLTLEEALRVAMANSEIIKSLGGRVGNVEGAPGTLLAQNPGTPGIISSMWDPAISETNPGGSNLAGIIGRGPEAALADFDAQLRTSMIWEKNDRPVNSSARFSDFFQDLQQDLGTFQTELAKFNATGGQTFFRHNVVYDWNTNPTREDGVASDWNVNFEAEVRQPLLQGAGTEFNRIFGPSFAPGVLGNQLGTAQGVVVSRINVDISLAQFEIGVRDFLCDVEEAYWRLYFDYRNLEAQKAGRTAAQEAWRQSKERERGGIDSVINESQAREQFFLFANQVNEAQAALFRSERRLRYLMGLSTNDGRLIRPADEPTTASVDFDWNEIRAEALVRNTELRQQKWRIKASELQLVAAKNFLLPRFDFIGRYRWLGLGDDLISSNRSGAIGLDGSNAWESLTGGDFQEWQLGFQLNVPLGFRGELINVRHRQLGLIRDKQVLREQENELMHRLADEVSNTARYLKSASISHSRYIAAVDQEEATRALYEAGQGTLEPVLDAQRRVAEAGVAYHQAVVEYNLALCRLHAAKGSIWEYDDVYLAEGPWPNKAYYDAKGKARQRDAARYLNYGFTQPRVVSRGPVQPTSGGETVIYDGPALLDGTGSPTPAIPTERIPTPAEVEEAIPVSSAEVGVHQLHPAMVDGATGWQRPFRWGSLAGLRESEQRTSSNAQRMRFQSPPLNSKNELPADTTTVKDYRPASDRIGSERRIIGAGM